jgi:hypothetical protein
MNPFKNMAQGEDTPAAALRWRRAAVVETVTGDPCFRDSRISVAIL